MKSKEPLRTKDERQPASEPLLRSAAKPQGKNGQGTMVHIQRTVGNQAAQRLLSSKGLAIMDRGHEQEKAAERNAEAIGAGRKPEPATLTNSGLAQASPAREGATAATRFSNGVAGTPAPAAPTSSRTIAPDSPAAYSGGKISAGVRGNEGPPAGANVNSGQPLPLSVRRFFEQKFQHDLGGVRLYLDDRKTQPTAAWQPSTNIAGRSMVAANGLNADAVGLPFVQTRLRLGQSDDRYEHEAEQFADRVTNGGSPEPLSRGGSAMGKTLNAAAASLVLRALQSSPGQPLSPALRRRFEPSLPVPISSVRLHANAEAAAAADALGAQAFTTGSDIVFGVHQFNPATRAGRSLIAHELAHVAQQSAAGPGPQAHTPGLLQRRDKDTEEKSTDVSATDEVAEEQSKYKWINYAKAAEKNRKWFDLLKLRDMNPLAPYDPFNTPNAFINRVVAWQLAVSRRSGSEPSFSEFIFAASEEQAKVREGSRPTVLAGLGSVAKTLAKGTFKPGLNVGVDGVIGPSTLWTMMVAEEIAVGTKEGWQKLKAAKIPFEMVDFDELTPGAYDVTWSEVHAFQFNKAKYKADWTTLVQASTAFETFEEMDYLPDLDADFLRDLFFVGELPDAPELTDEDLIAIMARCYEGEALEVLASVTELDRDYLAATDIERLVLQKKPDWSLQFSLRMGETQWARAQKLIDDLELDTPAAAAPALTRLQENNGNPPPGQPLSALVVVVRLPRKDKQFYKDTAKKYVEDKIALEKAASEATQDYLAKLQKTYKERMEGTPDLEKSDAAAFLELLTGDAFDSAQKTLQSQNSGNIPGVEIIQKLQPRTGADKASKLYALAKEKDYLIVQLSDNKDERFPLPLRQIDASRAAAVANGKSPFMFDFIDTPHAAFHGYTPTRFTARKTKDGAQLATGPYELVEGEGARSWESWKYRITHDFSTFDPVLIEVNEFNPDAGFLVRSARQIGGTDKIVAQYFWTLGGSLPNLSEQLWSAQTKINIMGWVDAVLTVVALSSLVSAPLIAGTEAAGTTAAAEIGEAAITAAMRRALFIALRKFVISEVIGETLNRISYYVNSDPDVPEGLKKAWNGLMIALLIYGGTKLVRQGIKAYRNIGTGALRAEVENLEKQLDAQVSGVKSDVSASEAAAEAEIEKGTTEKFKEATAAEGAQQPSGAGRVRSDDPRAEGVTTKPEPTLTPEDTSALRKALGDDVAAALEGQTNEPTRKRLAQIKDPGAIQKLVEAFKPKELAKILAAMEIDVLAEFAKKLDKEGLTNLLKAFSGKPSGVRLMRAFATDPLRLSALLGAFDGPNLMSLAENPGAERFFVVAQLVDPAILGQALKRMGSGKAGSMARFRNLLEAVGPERTAQVLNTYTPGEISARWRREGQLSAAQKVTSLAIKLDRPTVNRARLGAVAAVQGDRPRVFSASDIGTFYAVGPEAKAPAGVRSILAALRTATAAAVTRLNELIERAAKGMVTSADLQALPPEARATVEAFLDAGAKDLNRDALYGSAVQYLAEAELRRAYGGTLPKGLLPRKIEVRVGKTLIPDLQLVLTLDEDLRFPEKNTSERVVFDWTTKGQAGKIEKYAGGTPPVTYGVELIQPGPPPVPASPSGLPVIVPGKIGEPPKIENPPPEKSSE